MQQDITLSTSCSAKSFKLASCNGSIESLLKELIIERIQRNPIEKNLQNWDSMNQITQNEN
jgi:hypothetical protein